jgi:hypothetical protein
MSGMTNQVLNLSNSDTLKSGFRQTLRSGLFVGALVIAWLPFIAISVLASAFDSVLHTETLAVDEETRAHLVKTNVVVSWTQLWSAVAGLVLSGSQFARSKGTAEGNEMNRVLFCYAVPMVVIGGAYLFCLAFAILGNPSV